MALFQRFNNLIEPDNPQSVEETLHAVEVKSNRYLARIVIALGVLLLLCWGMNVIGIFQLDEYLLNVIAWAIFLVYAMLYVLSVLLDCDHEILKYFLVGGISISCLFAGVVYRPLVFFIIVPALLCINYCQRRLTMVTSAIMMATIPITDYIYSVTSYRSSEYDMYYAYFEEPVTLIQQGWYTTNLKDVFTESEAISTYFRYHTIPMVLFMTICFVICVIATRENYNMLMLQCAINEDKANAELEMAKKETELVDSNNRLMLSQIQPHFLYNVLNSIYYLCDENPEQAQEAISDFSDYLRTNMDVLKNKDFVTFDHEKKHIDTYLRLEKMRFGERLRIEEDIEVTDFCVPELGLQPIVENAVKHGVCQKEGGGTVTIRTREQEGAYVVIIEDDGIGFDPNSIQEFSEDGRSHVGLANIQSRIELLCHGTVAIDSTINVGTKVTVIIPKEEDEKLEDSGN